MRRFLPLIMFGAMIALFAGLLLDKDRNPKELKSVLIDQPAPMFALPPLQASDQPLTTADLQKGQPVLVNFFASWCVPCRAEHENLMTLSRDHGIKIIGVAYKNKAEDAQAFLQELGDPFDRTAMDLDGRTAIDFGVSGVPETFLINGQGVIKYRHWGPIVGDSLTTKLLPAIAEVKNQ